jgi:hypothetical protein
VVCARILRDFRLRARRPNDGCPACLGSLREKQPEPARHGVHERGVARFVVLPLRHEHRRGETLQKRGARRREKN